MTRDDVFDSKEIERMKDFVSDYDYVMNELNEQITLWQDIVTDEGLSETLDYLVETLEINEKSRYEEYKEQIEEYENFDPRDYNDNEGLKEEYERSKL